MESKNLSIMLTDLHGYSERSASSSRSDMADLIKTHNNLLRPVIDFYRGRVIKGLGDAFLCAFESATDASVCSIAVQVIVQEYNKHQRDEAKRLSIRVMISSGDVSLDQGDVYGEAVNLVSRMEKLPEFSAGGIGLSESTYLLMNRQEIVAELLGEHTFKGIAAPVKVYRIPLDKQKLTDLPTKLLDLVQQVHAGKAVDLPRPAPPGKKKRNLWIPVSIVLVVILMIVVGVALKRPRWLQGRMRPPGAGMAANDEGSRILGWIRRSDLDRDGEAHKKDFVGPPEVFDRLDTNKDELISVDEVIAWSERERVNLPPPPGGMRNFGPRK